MPGQEMHRPQYMVCAPHGFQVRRADTAFREDGLEQLDSILEGFPNAIVHMRETQIFRNRDAKLAEIDLRQGRETQSPSTGADNGSCPS